MLIIEDEPDLAALIADYARANQFEPTIIHDGQVALDYLLQQQSPIPNQQSLPRSAILVLDLMLPRLDGLSLCRAVRTFSNIPIIMVTAKVEEIDRLIGLDAGADDYLCKPFSPRELIARCKTILKRCQSYDSELSKKNQAQLSIDIAKQSALFEGKIIDLTRSEFLLLQHFVMHPSRVFSRAQLLDIACEEKLDVTDRAIDSHIKNLRKKLQLITGEQAVIHSIYGVGYRFDGVGSVC
ncbi:winged helix-turn-helix domain-containing protein [Undibacterium sp. FT137W]|uniref:Winged helix-turn-helix domain-containing protein n=2 Tax=Undibacterium fentianense TaxID=2828728 RepID=A0A941ID78_9BURK|nr:winged helix-turn-helix domain-containing protein [Undibacterium fentianense]